MKTEDAGPLCDAFGSNTFAFAVAVEG